ncbi:hypothetical protein GD627_10195 [Arthrobacter yangruifuii]|uniref:Uncharacterized protein n=1 Tax=Arthrobacter yangruifuii TaxID=2606616 RepID=A0A5N6MHF2_9MICC|nr:hypothetical protein [Arthrobacter yangruifuii]KAD3633185.1 hypothetical protein GD627_10195 [Arthrobacter yangruifuii]
MKAGWERDHVRQMVAVMLSTFVALWLLLLLPFDEPWNWLMVCLFLALTAASLRMLAQLVRRRRQEYWHEREKG